MNQKMMALIALAVVIPLAMSWVAYSGGLLLLSSPKHGTSESTNASSNHTLIVVTSFFPLYDFAKHVGGNKVNVTTMVPVGVEPHDWEPTTQQIQRLLSADLFVYNGAGIDRWADKCAKLRRLDPSRREFERRIYSRIGEVIQERIPHMGIERIRKDHPVLYEMLSFTECSLKDERRKQWSI